jgi:hypothetical protein
LKPKKIKKYFPTIDYTNKTRYSIDTIRRVWSRRDFEPLPLWPCKTFKNQKLDYNFFNFIDEPPVGNKHGLKTHKVFYLFYFYSQIQILKIIIIIFLFNNIVFNNKNKK